MEGAMNPATPPDQNLEATGTDIPRLVLRWYSYWSSRWMVETHDSLNDAITAASGLDENDAGRNYHIEVVAQDGTSRVYSGAEVVELVSAYQRSHRPTPQPHVPTPTVMVRTTVPASGESEWAEDDTIEAYRTDPEERAAQLAAILGPDRVKVERRWPSS